MGRKTLSFCIGWGICLIPTLTGYWGSADVAAASDFVLALIAENPAKVDGIKISLLDQAQETLRQRLPKGVKLYTGDDFNYPDLIKGDGGTSMRFGIFAAIAPAASHALAALKQEDMEAYDRIFTPTVPLAREIFRERTRFLQGGIAFWRGSMVCKATSSCPKGSGQPRYNALCRGVPSGRSGRIFC